MKKVMVDTNVYSAFKAGEPDAVKWFSLPDSILVCTAVLGELLAGFKCGSKERINSEELAIFLDTPRVSVAVADEETAEFYAEIFKALKAKGRPIPTNDMWIAASALQHGAAVCSYDSHFSQIDGLIVCTPV
jgi:tRNA(fMet)-specific endonuclease VapC